MLTFVPSYHRLRTLRSHAFRTCTAFRCVETLRTATSILAHAASRCCGVTTTTSDWPTRSPSLRTRVAAWLADHTCSPASSDLRVCGECYDQSSACFLPIRVDCRGGWHAAMASDYTDLLFHTRLPLIVIPYIYEKATPRTPLCICLKIKRPPFV
ncbi:hypothetical protein L207DRAFT_69617 [Hyaloscypha variabilis F]|uniref:Uncharacterized protein n=1 Tax=Hyaloscypha variabilis (strain UAMH 11265 / GT02V1 / F) TaxID=1149755 RepID=A0A2J6RIX7_HYAVF|nr:hypothetical protein L207DRAFT_69617 [Hyaloscypha variabilis F]